MFWNMYKCKLLRIVRNRYLLIWTFVFPFILSTLFYFTFSSLDADNQFQAIRLGVVNDEAFQNDAMFKNTIEALSAEGDEQMFITSYADRAAVDDMLRDNEISGYIQIVDGSPKLFVKENGLKQTIMKCFLDQYSQTKSSIAAIIKTSPDAVQNISGLFDRREFTKKVSLTKNPQTDRVCYFYALLAMVCFYGGFMGMEIVEELQANLTGVGARRTVSSARRYKLVAADMLAGLTSQFIIMVVLCVYLEFALDVSLGSNIWAVLLICLVGSLAGISFGAMITVSNKLKASTKSAILITVTMIMSFMSGLMVEGINYIIMQKAPVVAWLNPAARIADAFYCLYYFDSYNRYFTNIIILLLMTAVMFSITVVFLRRQRYESI
ncbi:MAG: ABC transporter permease [Lachnospiraceae bacterium]|nr:ABC transporter permease [Lachnospiraceae bacterium]